MSPPDRYAWEIGLRDSGVGDAYFLAAMLVLRTRLDADGYAFPSMDTWARDARISVRKLRDVVSQAVRTGWLEVLNAGRSGQGWKRHGYRITTPERAARRASPSGEVRHTVHHVAPVSEPQRAAPGAATCGTPCRNVRHTVPTNQDINQDKNQDSVSGLRKHENLPKGAWAAWLMFREESGYPCDAMALQPSLDLLAKFDPPTQISIIYSSLQRGSSKLRPPRSGTSNTRSNP